MNYYKRHIGDYLKDTAHLSILEHGVYTRLLDVYYTRETGIPQDQAGRLIGARSKDELTALKSVLAEFFTLDGGTYKQTRCDTEIADSQAKANANRLNGRGGGRPKKKPNNNPDGFLEEPKPNPNITLANSHKPIAISQDNTLSDIPTKAGAVCVVLKSEGFGSVNPQNQTLRELLGDGAEVHEFVEAARIAKEAGKGFAYALGIVKNARADAKRLAEDVKSKPPKPDKSPAWWTSDASIEVKGVELGLTPRPGENWQQFRGRIDAEIQRRKDGA